MAESVVLCETQARVQHKWNINDDQDAQCYARQHVTTRMMLQNVRRNWQAVLNNTSIPLTYSATTKRLKA